MFVNVYSIKFRGYPSSGSHADTREQTDGYEYYRAFRDYASARIKTCVNWNFSSTTIHCT
jgi:hypothetical protein